MNSKIKALLPHVVAIVLFIGLASAYFSPVFDGYSLRQPDVKQFQGMAKEIVDYRLMNGKEPLWTNSMFGGMPAYQISVLHDDNVFIYVDRFIKLGLPTPVGILFTAMLGFYIFALCLRINPWLGIVGAIAFGFSTINILYLAGGHVSKVDSIAYMAPALGGLILAFRGKWLLGSIVFAFFFALNVTANHLQMTYYLGFLLLAVAIEESIRLLIQKDFLNLGKAVGGLAIGALLGILPSSSNLLTTLEYSKFTTRGATDLTIKPKNPTNVQEKEGLNKNYILEYNFGPKEILSIVAPDAKGGKGDYLGNDEKAMEAADPTYSQQISQMNRYWGGQASSGGAFYFGVVMLAFFVLGLILLKDSLKWPFLAIFMLAVLLASNDPGGMNDFFINKVPMYNKFRDSKMILALLQVMIPALGVLFLDRFFKKEGIIGDKKIWLYVSGGVVFIGIILYAVPSISGSFLRADEINQFNQAVKGVQDPNQISFVNGLKQALIDTRISLYRADMGRALFLVILACGLVLLSVYTQISKLIITGIAFALVTYDNISVSKRYLNNEENEQGVLKSYEVAGEASAIPTLPQTADNSIFQKESSKIPNFNTKVSELTSKMSGSIQYEMIENTEFSKALASFGILNLNSDYRVLSFSNAFAETTTSYFHKSIGGYHGAKLKRYQEIVDFYINDEMMKVRQEFINKEIVKRPEVMAQYSQAKGQQEQMQVIENFFQSTNFDSVQLASNYTPVLNMLNTKYFISGKEVAATVNPNANGAAWFTNDVKAVNSTNDEMSALKDFNSKTTAVVNTTEFPTVKVGNIDTNATITLTQYGTDVLTYASNSKTELPAVFSEIYYPAGWNCYIDGKSTNATFRANYILRGAMIPAGKHKIEWKFEPQSFSKGATYSSIFSILTLLLFFGTLAWEGKAFVSKKEEEAK